MIARIETVFYYVSSNGGYAASILECKVRRSWDIEQSDSTVTICQLLRYDPIHINHNAILLILAKVLDPT